MCKDGKEEISLNICSQSIGLRNEAFRMSKVLLVEDNLSAVKRIKEYIKKVTPQLEVITFSQAGEAYCYAQKEAICVFIIDIQLADYKGTSLAKQLRSLQEYKYTPIIFETALAGEELMAYRDVKCYGFLIKPFGEEEFKTVFRDALGLGEQITGSTKTIQIEQRQFVLEYQIQEIAFLEAFGKRVIVHTNSKRLGVKSDIISGYTLAKLYALIDDPSFVQCHKSYIVNRSHIERIHKIDRQIVLKGMEEILPIGNKFQSALWS